MWLLGLYIMIYTSDLVRQRSYLIAASMSIGVNGMIVLVSSANVNVRYGFAHVAVIGAGTINPLVAAWITDNTAEKANRAVNLGFMLLET